MADLLAAALVLTLLAAGIVIWRDNHRWRELQDARWPKVKR